MTWPAALEGVPDADKAPLCFRHSSFLQGRAK
jgi:hypothetical protein